MSERTIVARGNLPLPTHAAAVLILESLGFTVETVDENDYSLRGVAEEIKFAPYTFDEIHNSEQYIGFEHVKEFRRKYAADTNESGASRVFNVLVNPQPYGTDSRMTDDAFRRHLGLIVERRATVGFVPLPRDYFNLSSQRQHLRNGQLVSRVDGVINFVSKLGEEPYHRVCDIGVRRLEFLGALATKLETQVTA